MFPMHSNELRIALKRALLTLAASGLLSSHALAAKKHYGAHQHGVATVNVVAEGNSITIQLETPADSIYGFEHEAKKPADIKKRDAAIDQLKSKAQEMFVLEPALNCKVVSTDLEPFVTERGTAGKKTETHHTEAQRGQQKKHNHAHQHKKGTHAEVHATFKFECEKPLKGTTLLFAVQRHFKALRTLKVQVLSGDKQSGLTVTNDKGSVSL